MRCTVLVHALVAFVASLGSARAEWLHNVEDDPFRGGEVHVAMAIATDFSGFVAGFRCSSADDLTLVFVTPEKTKDIPVPDIDKIPVKLLVITDDAEKVALDAKIETTPSGEQFRFSADGEQVIKVLKAAWDARKRFAVASELLGQVGQSKSFDMRGSSRAIEELVNGCKLKLAESAEPTSKSPASPIPDNKPQVSPDGPPDRAPDVTGKREAPTSEPRNSPVAWCAVVNAIPDGFLNLRAGPGVEFPITGKVRSSDFLEIATAECQKNLCDRTHRWVFVEGVPRLEGSLGGITQGWVNTDFIRQVRCASKEPSPSAREPGPAISKPVSPSEQRTHWIHNGSIVYLEASGPSRRFYYHQPKPAMIEVGAQPGSLVFDGQIAGNNYTGTAYIFNRRCGRIPYKVQGPILDEGRRVVMTGQAPLVDQRCNVIGSLHDTLEFTLVPSE